MNEELQRFKRPVLGILMVLILPSIALVLTATSLAQTNGREKTEKNAGAFTPCTTATRIQTVTITWQIVAGVLTLAVDKPHANIDPTQDEVHWSCPTCKSHWVVLFDKDSGTPFSEFDFHDNGSQSESGCAIVTKPGTFDYTIYYQEKYLDPQVIIQSPTKPPQPTKPQL